MVRFDIQCFSKMNDCFVGLPWPADLNDAEVFPAILFGFGEAIQELAVAHVWPPFLGRNPAVEILGDMKQLDRRWKEEDPHGPW